MNNAKNILVVDDEETLCEALRFNLEAAGYNADTALSAEEALSKQLSDYDLILLDIMMEGISGIQMAQIIKKNPATKNIPIIFCTAKDTEDDMIKGLKLGADDYITKPYSLKNVLARVEAVLRRCAPSSSNEESQYDIVEYKGLTLFATQKCCMINGQEIKLPRKEFEILLTLLENKGKVFSRAELLQKIWPDEVVVLDRVVDVNITRLRHKLGEYGKNIVTRTGYGYLFVE